MITNYFNKHTDARPLVVFRILFGLMMFASMIRFWANGWIDKLYIKPTFFFSYYGFEWVKPCSSSKFFSNTRQPKKGSMKPYYLE